MDYECEKLHECLLMIAKEIKRICEKNNIKYFLIGGSLLGAVRHNGFIPWDDDMDIGMLRKDYDEFIRVCKYDLGEAFHLCSLSTEEYYSRPFAKLRLRGTYFPDYGQSENIDNGIYVDIFPIDVMPIGRFRQKVQILHIKLWRNSLSAKLSTFRGTRKNKIIYMILTSFRILPKKMLVRNLVKWETKYNNSTSFCYYINFSSNYKYGREIFPKESLCGQMKYLPFEDTEFMVPSNYEAVLKQLYNDYMKLPPVDQQVFKHADGKIDFGKYGKKNKS